MTAAEETSATIQEISFASGEFQLRGTLHLPSGVPSPPVVIGSHGLFSTGNSPKQIALARTCTSHGIAYLRFDHRGCGQSDGAFREVTSLDGRRKDLLSAVSAVLAMEETGSALGLFGSSLGGAAVLSVARESGAAVVVTYAAPLTGARIVEMLKAAEAPVDHPEVDPEMLHFDVSSKTEGIANILILHGDSDRIVSPSEAHRIYQKARMPKRLILLKNGDHAMGLAENQEKFVREASSWFKAGFR
jgi:alpha-beta hydrolase superfamily lysophospholipase